MMASSNMESILTSIKKLLGLTEDYTPFDPDITMHINTVLMVLNQLGVGPVDGYFITDEAQTWTDYLGDDKSIESVKTYIYAKVKLIFDPPQSGTHVLALESLISEFEWRLMVAKDPVPPVAPLFPDL